MTSGSLHVIVLLLSVLIALFLLYFLFSSKKQPERTSKRPSQSPPPAGGGKPCPLCGESLRSGEKVHSIIYPGKPDKLMEIYGCPHCEKGPNDRTCPVCKKIMETDSVLIARVFEKPGKTHVHVLGCSGCYSGRTKVGKPKA